MLALPIPVIVALVLVFLFLRALLAGERLSIAMIFCLFSHYVAFGTVILTYLP